MKKNIFITSDTHFLHFNIIKFCNRPFNSIKEHDECLMDYWNQIVKPQDTIIHLGDLALGSKRRIEEITSKLNGKKQLILGNHDRKKNITNFEILGHYHELNLGHKKKVILSHYPFLTWNKKHWGSWCFHGHTHQHISIVDSKERLIHVGVDSWNFKPISIDEIISKWYRENESRKPFTI